MNCNYPNCRQKALWTPVIEIPTVRSQGLIKPQLSPLINQPDKLDQIGVSRTVLIASYEQQVQDYHRREYRTVTDSKPTLLLGREVCQTHRDSYNVTEWIGEAEWNHLKEAARANGYIINDVMITVRFMPVGWRPPRHLENRR